MNILRSKKKTIIIILLIFSATIVIVSDNTLLIEEYQPNQIESNPPDDLPKLYTDIGYLHIDSDEDFITLGFPGNGTLDDPYLIDSYIVRSNFSDESDFYITNVTKHFIIQNCQTEHLDGIILEGLNSGSAVLRSNQIMRINLFYPAMIKTCISIIDCSNVVVANNTCDSNVNGIVVSQSKNITVANNTVLNGINEPSSSRRYCGLSLANSENCEVYNNHFEEGGIYLDVSEEEIDSVLFENNTIMRWDSNLHLPIKTSILVFRSVHDVSFETSNYGQIMLIKCSNVSLFNMKFNNTFIGASTYFSSNCIIENGFSNLCQIGFLDYYSSNTKFKNITCLENVRGVQIISSDSCQIDGLTSTRSSSYEGLYIDENTENTFIQNSNCSYNSWSTGVQDSGLNTTFSNNFFEYNYIGISLWSSSNSTLIGNEISHNKNHGIYIAGATNVLLFENSVSFNRNFGVYVTNSITGIISTNLIFGTEGYGVYLSSTTENFVIYWNSFINNEPLIGTSQAFDCGTGNYWYNPEIKSGNFWFDIGSKNTYQIDGDADSVDLFPLKDPIYYPDEFYSWKTSYTLLVGFLVILLLSQSIRSIKRKK